MILDCYSQGPLGTKTETGLGAKRMGGRGDWEKQREEEGCEGLESNNGEKTQGRMVRGQCKSEAQRRKSLMGERTQH